MAFADPQSVTINGVATSVPRTAGGDPTKSAYYKSADGNVELRLSQFQTSNRFRREARLTQRKIAADPISAVNREVSASLIIVVDQPRWGFSIAELQYLSAALVAWYTNANRDKLLGGEF